MKGLFITYKNSSGMMNGGIEKKIKAQMLAFNEAGLNCSEYKLDIRKSIFYALKWRLPFFNVSPVWKYDESFECVDYLYMRRPFVMNKYMYKVLKKTREKNPDVKILIEIPTYPYDPEYDEYRFCQFARITDKKYRNKMKEIIDYFVTVTDDNELFGTATLKIKNGIDLSKIETKKHQEEKNGEIHICAIAQFKYWHGYERFIHGLSDYYKNGGNRTIFCEFVGEGSESQAYKDLVDKLDLSNNIHFHGFLTGKELLDIYNKSSIAIGSLGCYKKGIYYSCDLKSREALGRGIPMVIGCRTENFDANTYKYFYEFPNDSSILDINKVIEFHDNIYKNEPGQSVVQNIRAYAEQTVDTNICMKPVLEFLFNSKNETRGKYEV